MCFFFAIIDFCFYNALHFFIYLINCVCDFFSKCRDIYKKGKGAPVGKVSRNNTKKRNKYGKIDKHAGKVEAEW